MNYNFVTGIIIFLFFNKFPKEELQQVFVIFTLAITIIIIIIMTEEASLFAMVE